jgi:hypothetical protein
MGDGSVVEELDRGGVSSEDGRARRSLLLQLPFQALVY